MYDGERADADVLDQLETILRHVADELATWRARALKAEGDLKDSGARSGAGTAKPDVEARSRAAELEQENRQLRLRVEAARARVQDLVSRLAFLEEQARETVAGARTAAGGAGGLGSGGSVSGGGAAGIGGGSAAGSALGGA